MKKRISQYRLFRNFLLLCIGLMFLNVGAPAVKAADRDTAIRMTSEQDDSNGVLQNGGLLDELRSKENLYFSGDRSGNEAVYAAIMTALDHYETTVDLSSYALEKEEVFQMIHDIVNRNPKYFYYVNTTLWSSGGKVIRAEFRYQSDSTDELRRQSALYESAVAEALAPVQADWSDLEKILYANDYLALNCEYDLTYSNYSAYDVFVNKTAVCQGYALAYLELMNRMNVSCELVTSRELNHAWNLVRMGTSWYHVDVTWNDPVKDRYGRARHLYLLKSESWFQSQPASGGTHEASDYVFTGNVGSQDAADTSFDQYFWNSVDAPFGYYDGYWYANADSVLKRYSGSNSGLSETGILKKLTARWYVWNSSTSFWTGSFEGCAVFAGYLYYATPTEIRKLDLSTGMEEPDAVYTLSGEEREKGYIYGFYITNDGVLKYGLAQAPNEEAQHRELKIHEHSFGNWEILTAPGCEKAGVRKRSCACGKTVTEEIPPVGHTPGPAATCTKDQKCTQCGAVLSKAAGHSYDEGTVTKEPDCANSGIRTFRCTRCKAVKEETIKRTGKHTYGKWKEKKAATFVAKGSAERKCSCCGRTEKKSLPKITCKKGAAYTVKGCVYKIVSARTNGKGTVAFAGLGKKKGKGSFKVPDTVTILGAKFSVVQINDKALKNQTGITSVTVGKNVSTIGKEAFAGMKKVKTITIKSTKLTKVGSNALKNIYSKAKVKVPASRLKKYKALFKNKGQKKTVKIM